MSARRRLSGAASALASLGPDMVLGMVAVAARPLSFWSVGRLLRSVSMPRLREHRLRSTLTLAGIAFGVAAVMAVLLVNRAVVHEASKTIDDLAGKADLEVTGGATGFDDELVDRVASTEGVYKAAPVIQQTALVRESGAKGDRLLILGVDLVGADDRYFRAYDDAALAEVKRDPVAFVDSDHHLLLGREIADRLHKRLHDPIALETPTGLRQFDICGFLDGPGVSRAFNGAVAVMHYQAMQAAFQRRTRIDRVDVAVAPGTPVDRVAATLRERLGAGLGVAPPQERASGIASVLHSLRVGMLESAFVAAQIGLFLIYNTLLISIVQRRREIGVLRALGLRSREIVLLFTLEAAVIGAVGSILGVLLGAVVASGMVRGMSQTVSTLYLEVAASHASPEPRLVLGCVAFGTLATALSAFLAARQAASIRPAESLRAPGPPPPAAAPRGGSIRDLCGAALLAIALPALRLYPHWGRPAIWVALAALVVGGCLVVSRIVLAVHATVGRALGQRLGVAARMASENLPRDLTRTSVTSGALMVSLGMAAGFAVLVSSFVGTVSDWVERSIMADIFVTSTTPGFMRNVAMSSALGDELAAIPGTGVVERVRLADLELRGRQVRVEAYDILDAAKGAHEDAVEGTYEQIAREVHEGTSVAVSENLSRKFGIHLGDRIDLQGKDGPLSFRVAGVLVDYASDLGTIMMDRAAYARGWGDDLVDMYKIHVKPGADVEGIRRLINEREGSRFDLVVLTGEEWKAHVLGQLRRVFALIRALEGVALVVAGFGICNALSANVLDRVRELGVLRAVGLLRSQVRRMVVAEATLVGLAGVVAGLPLGVAIGRVLVFSVDSAELTGWSVRFAPAWTNLAELALLGVAISAASGWYPARAAASLQVTGALAYE